MTWLDKCVDCTCTKIFIEMRNVINDAVSSSRYWSKCVDKVWDENCEHGINLNFSFELKDVNQNSFITWDGHSNNETWKVMHHDDKPPECECGIFLSSKVCHFVCMYYLF